MLTVLQLLTLKPAKIPRGIGRIHRASSNSSARIKKGALTDDMLLKIIADYQEREGTEIHVAELAEIIDRATDTTGDRLRRLLLNNRIYRAGLSGQFRYGVMPPRG